MARRRVEHSEASARPAVTDPDLVRLMPKYGPEGQRVLEALQSARDRNRSTQLTRPPSETSSLYDTDPKEA